MEFKQRNGRVKIASQGPEPPRAIDPARLGAIVRSLRERLRLRQRDLAIRAKVAPNTVAGLEAGRRTQAINVEKIAKALGTTAEALQTGEYVDADQVLQELTSESIDVARIFIASPTSVRDSVLRLLRTGRRDWTDRIYNLDPEDQAAIAVMVDAAEERQRRERVDHGPDRFADSGIKPYGR